MEKTIVHKRMRLPAFDYSSKGAYFVTICTKDRRRILSRLLAEQISPSADPVLTGIGKIVDSSIASVPTHYPGVFVDYYVIMPNHVHLLLRFTEENSPKLGRIIQQLKGFVKKHCGQTIWQDKYYDHVIRDENDYLIKAQYIENNPAKWIEDEYY